VGAYALRVVHNSASRVSRVNLQPMCCPPAVRSGCFALLLLQFLAVQASVPLPTGGHDPRGNTAPAQEGPADRPESESAEVEQWEIASLDIAPLVPKCVWLPVPPPAPSGDAESAAEQEAESKAEVSSAATDAEEEPAREAVMVPAANCTLNWSWAERQVDSDAAQRTVRRAFHCARQETRHGCAAEKFCNWLEDEGKCDMGVEHGVLDILLSSVLQPGRPAGTEVSRHCGFAGELRRQLAACEAVSLDGSCPSHCKEAKAECLYRSGSCGQERRCALNASRFWHDTCRSDVGERCGLTIGDWSWAWPRAGRSHEKVVSCLQRHCPTAANFYRHLFSVQDRCSGLNASECSADSTCFAWEALNSSICEASPEALAPRGCGFGELEAAAWYCNQRNRSACTGDCQYVEGGMCWHNDLADVCIANPSKVPLHMSHTPEVCSLTSSAALRVLAEALREPEVVELARLADHEATCNAQTNAVDCADVPIVIGQLQLNVSDPQAFASDRSARDAVAKGIAAMAWVPREAVIVRLSVVGEPERRLSPELEMAGQVNADYTIFVPAGRDAAGVAGTLSSTDTETATDEIMKALEENNLGKTYVVEVKHIKASASQRWRHFPVANSAPLRTKPYEHVHRLMLMASLTLVAL